MGPKDPTEVDYSRVLPFRRSVEIRLSGDDLAVAEVEDDHHHFSVSVLGQAGMVARVSAQVVRRPWTMCALAALELEQLVGSPLSGDPAAVLQYANIREQCTHMFDLAGLAIAALGRVRQPALRRYDMSIRPLNPEQWRAHLVRDDGLALDWLVRLGEIEGPESLRGVSLKAGFVDWARSHFEGDGFEAALLLRRTIFVGKNRHLHDLDERDSAADGTVNVGGCFVLQPGKLEKARRIKGATIRFPPSGPGPLARE